jgi:hypothetical protein
MPGAPTMEEIFRPKSLVELRQFLTAQPRQRIRKELAKRFLKACLHTSAEEWNQAVRLCEALTIVGWGDLEPVEATRGVSWNGGPETAFYNRFSQPRFVDAIWFKRKAGLTMQQGYTSYHFSPDLPKKPELLWDYPVQECVQDVKLEAQRNWIPKNPILILRSLDNCYPGSKKLVDDLEGTLKPAFDQQMVPEKYGTAFDRLVITCSLSYDDGSGPNNFIILDEDVRLSSTKLYERLRKMYSASEIEKNGYFLRKRCDYGPFQSDRGAMKVEIHFSKEFSEQTHKAQKRDFTDHLITAVDGAIARLKAKKLEYDFEAMRQDFQTILQNW